MGSHGIPRDTFKNCLVPWDAMGYFKNFSSHGTGYFSKTFHPMGWDTFQKFFVPWDGIYFKNFHSSHPMGRNLIEKRPMGWDGMGWDGTGWDYPIPRGALVRIFI